MFKISLLSHETPFGFNKRGSKQKYTITTTLFNRNFLWNKSNKSEELTNNKKHKISQFQTRANFFLKNVTKIEFFRFTRSTYFKLLLYLFEILQRHGKRLIEEKKIDRAQKLQPKITGNHFFTIHSKAEV